jgi:2'-5' RNA ligase
LLPPRCLGGTEDEARAVLARVCAHTEPFEVVLGDVETFIPVTPTVFIRVARYAYKMRELHDRLNTGALFADEPWPYMPHLTIAKMPEMVDALGATETARRRWNDFADSRRVTVQELTFVREGEDERWIDITPIPLNGRLAIR